MGPLGIHYIYIYIHTQTPGEGRLWGVGGTEIFLYLTVVWGISSVENIFQEIFPRLFQQMSSAWIYLSTICNLPQLMSCPHVERYFEGGWVCNLSYLSWQPDSHYPRQGSSLFYFENITLNSKASLSLRKKNVRSSETSLRPEKIQSDTRLQHFKSKVNMSHMARMSSLGFYIPFNSQGHIMSGQHMWA